MSTPPMPPGPQGPPPQGQPYPQAPQGQPYPQAPQGQFPGGQQPFQGGVPGTGPMPGQGQGGFPPGPGQPQPFPQAPMGQPPKRRRGLIASIGGLIGVIVIVIAVRVVISLGVGTVVSSTDDAHNTNVGDCASVTGTESKPSYNRVDCGSGKENYIIGMVIKAGDSCPSGAGYDEYYEEGTLNNVKLCLAPVLADGQCYNFDTSGQTEMGYKSIPCTDPKATQIKVTKGKADKTVCSDPSRALVYDPLKLTYCGSDPSGS